MIPIGTEPHPSITELLHQMRAGDESARDELISVVYRTLYRIAESQLRKERPDHSLQPTALVNEAYLKLFGHAEIEFTDRAHFFATVSRATRRILVDHARARATERRSGAQVELDTSIEFEAGAAAEPMKLLDLDLAIDALAHRAHEVGFAPWPRCCAGPASCRLRAVPTRARCENACGKLPSCRCAFGSYSSASRPISLRRESRRSNRADASASRFCSV